ncbi:MAG TPA: bacteriohemerythrin, partial [Rhodocyclaceae bacterium]|nr:bacteriohemerythrin [Rhodocyclaceae bacterium]
EIDDQHKVLFDVLNRLWAAIIKRAGRDEMLAIVQELERYTVAHFTAEEVFMRAVDYADRDGHKKSHQEFIDRLASEKKVVLAGGSLSLDLLKFLKDWLANHILVSDKAYSRALRQRNEPQTAFGRFFKRLMG